MFALVGFLAVFFQVDGDEDELEVGEGSLVEPVVAGGGPTVVLHAVEDAFDHVPPLVRHAPLKRPCSRPGPYQRSSGVPIPGDNTPPDHRRQDERVIPEPATWPRPSGPTKHGNGHEPRLALHRDCTHGSF